MAYSKYTYSNRKQTLFLRGNLCPVYPTPAAKTQQLWFLHSCFNWWNLRPKVQQLGWLLESVRLSIAHHFQVSTNITVFWRTRERRAFHVSSEPLKPNQLNPLNCGSVTVTWCWRKTGHHCKVWWHRFDAHSSQSSFTSITAKASSFLFQVPFFLSWIINKTKQKLSESYYIHHIS